MVIELKNVIKNYGERKILEIESLKIEEKEKVGIIGQNGSGKTTLCNIISQKTKPDSGSVKVTQQVKYVEQFPDDNTNKSGGEKQIKNWRDKIFKSNGILIADEPSSNLDMNHIEEIKKELKKYQGTILLISHDRDLIDEICDHIIEIERGKVTKYTGNYTEYFKQKQEKLSRQEFEYKKYIEEKTRLEKAINISKNTSKSLKKTPNRMGNSEARLHKRGVENKREKLEGHTKSLETRLEKLEIKEKASKNNYIYMKKDVTENVKNKYIVRIRNLNIKFNNKEILKNANCVIESNKITAIVGPNGAGKTTLIKSIINSKMNSNIENSITVNPMAKIAYFSQELDILDKNKNILENVMKDTFESERNVKNILANLLIKEKDIEKSINDLSGGEKVKVCLAKILVSDANFLILDEPTNFLDIESIEGLEKLLKEYKGTILLVTHDKKLLDRLEPKLLIIDNQKIIEFEGKYDEYIKSKKQKESNLNSNINKGNKLLLEIKLAQISAKLANSKKEEKELLEKEYNKISEKLKQLSN